MSHQREGIEMSGRGGFAMNAARGLGAMLAGAVLTLSLGIAAGAAGDAPAKAKIQAKGTVTPKKPSAKKPASKGAEKAKAAQKKRDEAPPDRFPAPALASVFPAGGPRGGTVEVVVRGTNLDRATTAQVSGEGVAAKLLEGGGPTEARVALAIAPDAPTGERDLRLIGPGGVSNRQRVFVGDLPEVVEAEPNEAADAPQAIPSMPVLVNGQVLERDRDTFAVPLRAGQTFVADVLGRPIQPFIADAVPAWLEAGLVLVDPDGKVVAHCEDFRTRPDPLLIYEVPRDGTYRLELRDELDRGRADFVYRLRLGVLPALTGAFPLGGRRGETVHLALDGANLPTGSIDVAIPADAPARLPFDVERDGVRSNRLTLAAGDHPEVIESEPEADAPAPVAVPVTINGRIVEPGDVDSFPFAAKAGQALVLDVQARRLDSPLDAALTLRDAGGRVVARNDDAIDPRLPLLTHQADPHLLVKVPADGIYTVQVRDAQRRGGRDQAYRLTIAPPEPDFALRMTPDNLRMSAGETAMVTVNVLRLDGFPAPIALEVRGLPPGFVSSAAAIPAGQDQVSLTITAPAGAPLGVFAPTIVGTAHADGRDVVRTAEAAESVMQAFSWTHVIPTQGYSLAVVETPAAPFRIATELASGEALRVPRGGEATVAIRVTRDRGTTGGISVTAMGLPPGLAAKAVLIAPDQDRGELVLTAAPRVAEGLTTNLVVRAVMRMGRTSATRVLPAIPLEVTAGAPASSP
jgi:hypothetical protein